MEVKCAISLCPQKAQLLWQNTCQIRANAWSCMHANRLTYPLPPPPPGPNGKMGSQASKSTNGLIFLSQLLHKWPLLSAYWLKERREGKRKEVRKVQRGKKKKKWKTVWPKLQICVSGQQKILNGVPSSHQPSTVFWSLRVMRLF